MNAEPVEFQRTQIHPVECLKASKDLLGDQYWLFLGITIVGLLVASAAPLGILMGPMMCGMYLCYFRRMRGESVDFGMLFKGFDYFMESLLATLILVGVSMVLMVPVFCLMFGGFMGLAAMADHGRNSEPPMLALFGIMGLFFVVSMVLSLVVTVLFAFTYPLILDRGLKAWPAVCTSCRAAWANFGGMLGLVCLLFVISFLGSLCCYIPALLFMPFYIGTLAIVYRQVFPETPGPAVGAAV
jgi:hypothetical protein